MQGEANLDFMRLKEINETLGIPLVIHGGTGLNDEQFQQLIGCGVSKINYYTSLADKAGLRIRENAHNNPSNGYTVLTAGVKDAISTEVNAAYACGEAPIVRQRFLSNAHPGCQWST